MFLKFYGLREEPFGVTPDPRFLYLTPSHREAQATLEYGIRTGRGFAALVARPGVGKTTLLFHALQQYATTAKTAFLFQTQCDSREFMRYLLSELGIDVQITDVVHLHEEFNRLLLRESHAGRRVIIVVDEAQNLVPSVLETVRLLSDFETPRRKLLHIILAGQPELADKLAAPSLVQLRQRITHFVRLDTLTAAQTGEYIAHRLQVAGYSSSQPLFSEDARNIIHQRSEGVPRIINNLCFNALSLGYASDQKVIDAAIAQEASVDLDIDTFNWQVRGLRSAQPAPAAPIYKNTAYPAFVASGGGSRPAAQPAPAPRRAPVVPERIALVPSLPGTPQPAAASAQVPIARPTHPAVTQASAMPLAVASGAQAVQPAPEVRQAPQVTPPEATFEEPRPVPPPSPLSLEVDLDALAQDYALLEMEALRRNPSVAEQAERPAAAPPAPVAASPVLVPVQEEPVGSTELPVARIEPQPAPAPRGYRKYLVAGSFVLLLLLGWQISRAFTAGARGDTSGIAEASSPAAVAQPSASVDEPVVVAEEGAEAAASAADFTSLINVIGEVPQLGHHRGRPQIGPEKTEGLARRVDPIYPEAAKQALLQGSVVIDAAVASDGSLHHLRVVSGDPLLAQSAIDAVRGWRYRARSGRKTSAEEQARINVNFVLAANRGAGTDR